MFKGKERETMRERKGIDNYFCCLNRKSGLDGEFCYCCWLSLGSSPPEKIRSRKTHCNSFHNWLGNLFNSSTVDSSSGEEPQDADYTNYISPSLSFELESLIFARFPRSEHWKLSLVNKECLNLLKTGELFKIRRETGVKEPSVFMLATGAHSWWEFDCEFKSSRKLPIIPSDYCFTFGDKESLCAGNNLLVSGREVDGLVIWRYELVMDRWFKGPSMIKPRCLFASATSGTYAFVAGGIETDTDTDNQIHDTAEKYNPYTKSWELLPRMKQKRKLCSGFYMDNKFYVIGGRNENGALTCGEFFDEARNMWVLIPDMLKDDPVLTSHSPPLIAVVNNVLYSLEAASNQLKVYMKRTNTWKPLGLVPVRADSNGGWGVAFKSLGNKLLVIGASLVSSSSFSSGNSMAIYTCCPDPIAKELQWRAYDSGKNHRSHFILNCSVMMA